MKKREIIKRMREGSLIAVTMYFVRDNRYTETSRLVEGFEDGGESVEVHPLTRRSLALKVARKVVNGEVVSDDFVPTMKAGLTFTVFYSLR